MPVVHSGFFSGIGFRQLFPLIMLGALLATGCPATQPPLGPIPPARSSTPPLPQPVTLPLEIYQDLHPTTAVAVTENKVWLGTSGGGVLRFAPTGGIFERRFNWRHGLPSNQITALAAIGSDDLAVGTSAGLVQIRHGEEVIPLPLELPPGTAIQALACSPERVLWVGWSAGLERIELASPKRSEAALRDVHVTALRFDQGGDLWVGTKDQGLFQVVGTFAERYGAAHGLATRSISSLVTTSGGGIVALGALAEGGDLLSLYDGVQWYPLQLEQPNARWQLLGLAVIHDEVILLTGFGVRRVRQIADHSSDPELRLRTERYLAEAWPKVLVRPVPPPTAEEQQLASPEPELPTASAMPPLEMAELVPPPPTTDKKLIVVWKGLYEQAREARAAYTRAQVSLAALSAELDELQTRRQAAQEREAGLARRLASSEAAGAPPMSPEERTVLQQDQEAARLAIRQTGVAYELTLTKVKESKTQLEPLRAEALRIQEKYATSIAPGLAAQKARLPPVASPAAAAPSKVPGSLKVRHAPFVTRVRTAQPRLVLEPMVIKPTVLPGAVTLWQNGESATALWFATTNGGAWRWDQTGSTQFTAADLVPRHSQQGPLLDPAGNVWVITAAGSVARFDGARWREEALPQPERPAAAANVDQGTHFALALTQDGERRIVVATRVGGSLHLFRRIGEIWEKAGDRTLLHGSGAFRIQAWAIDPEGSHWMGLIKTDNRGDLFPAGLIVWQPGARTLTYHGSDQANAPPDAKPGPALPSDRVVRIMFSPQEGAAYIGTPNGLCRMAGGGLEVFDENSEMEAESVQDVAIGKEGEVWVATGEGCGRLNREKRWTFFRQSKAPGANGLPSNQVRSLSLAPDGTLWAATERGLARYVDARWQAVAAPSLSDVGQIRTIAFSEQGRAWVLLPDRLVALRLN